MINYRKITSVTITVAAAIVMMSSCSSSSTSGSANTDAVSSIVIEGSAFSVAGDVKSTDELSATNRDGITHTVTSDTGAFDVKIEGGATVTLPALTPGTYAFHCEIHRSMRGTITVI